MAGPWWVPARLSVGRVLMAMGFSDLGHADSVSESFGRLRDAMIDISDLTSQIAHAGSGSLNAADMEEIQRCAEVLRAEAPILLEWL